MNLINLFLSLFFKEKKIQGTNLFLCPFSKQQLITFARENLSMLNLFYISFSAQGERNGQDKFIFKPFFFKEKKIKGTNLFLCPFSKQQLMTFARENLFMLNFFTFLLAHKEKDMDRINLFLSLFFSGEKNPGDKFISLPLF